MLKTLLIFCFISSAVLAEEFRLFTRSSRQDERSIPHSDYIRILQAPLFKVGDSFHFSNGRVFRMGEKLGGEHNTLVFRLPEMKGYAIRIPGDTSSAPHDYREYFDRFAIGQEILKERNISVPELKETLSGEYQIVELFEANDMVDFFGFVELLKSANADTQREMLNALYEFAKTTATLEKIGDFKPANIIYQFSRKRFVILDMDDRISEVNIRRARQIPLLDNVFTKIVRTGFYGQNVDYFFVPWVKIERKKGQPFRYSPDSEMQGNELMVTVAQRVQDIITAERARLFRIRGFRKNLDGDLDYFINESEIVPSFFDRILNLCSKRVVSP